MGEKICISDLTLDALTAYIVGLGQPKFRAKQIFKWLHQKLVTEFSQMTDQPKALLAQLEEQCTIAAPVIRRRQHRAALPLPVAVEIRVEPGIGAGAQQPDRLALRPQGQHRLCRPDIRAARHACDKYRFAQSCRLTDAAVKLLPDLLLAAGQLFRTVSGEADPSLPFFLFSHTYSSLLQYIITHTYFVFN